MSGRLKSNRKPWEQLKRRLTRFDQRKIDIGFLGRARHPETNLYVGEVAWINDQGSSTVPPRPFMTVDFYDFLGATYHKKVKHLFYLLLFRKNVAFQKELGNIAKYYEDSLKEIIYDYPGHNSPEWAEYKTFDDPLYYTGTMVNAVSSRILKRSD